MSIRTRNVLAVPVLLCAMLIAFSTVEHYGYAQEIAATESPEKAELQKKLDRDISLDLRDMDVVDVYKFLAFKGNFNISISKNLAGRVTLFLKKVSVRDSLDIISLANGLAYKIMGENIIHVMTEAEYVSMYGKKFSDKTDVEIIRLSYAKPAYVLEALKNIKSDIGRLVIDEDSGSVVIIDTIDTTKKMLALVEAIDKPLETKIYNLKYANADDVAGKLRAKLDNKAVGSVQADARSNQLVIQAFPDRITEVETIIAALDTKTKAVLIAVRILKITLNPQYDMGISWEAIFDNLKGLDTVGSFPISSTVSTDASIGTVGKIAVGNLSSDDFTTELKLLKQVAETKVLSNPSLMVVNNHEARIHIGDKLAYVTTTTIGTGESQQVNETITFIDVGVQFTVTPTINDAGFITMAIKPEISSQAGTLETPQGSEVPLINTTLVETRIIVKDGHTVVIGGLKKDDYNKTKKGIPGLMNIPVIGTIFSNETKSKTQTEIVILLTPHIVTGAEDYADKKLQIQEGIRPDKEYGQLTDTVYIDLNEEDQGPSMPQPQMRPDKKY
ncbi:secretin N-terminal domain-containing protein [Candidatus Omnitrophota bacterium]